MAEYVMKDLVRGKHLENRFEIASAATSREELGNPVYPPARKKLAEHGIACGVYHACVHNMLYEKDEGVLRGLYKTATFTVRAAAYRRTGIYCSRLDELLHHADAVDKEIVRFYLSMKSGASVDFASASKLLFAWAKASINNQ